VKSMRRLIATSLCRFSNRSGIVWASSKQTINRFRSRTWTSKMMWKWRQNGVAYPYMGTIRHFHIVFDIRVLDLNLSIVIQSKVSACWMRFNHVNICYFLLVQNCQAKSINFPGCILSSLRRRSSAWIWQITILSIVNIGVSSA
jgi:hypothetical protein